MGGRRKLFKKFTNAWSRNTNVIGYTTANKMTQCYSFHYTYSQHLLCSYIVSQLNFQIESNYMHVYISLHWNQQAARMWRKWFPVVMIKLFTERMLDFAHIEALFCYYASVGGAPRHTVVVVFVCLCVCVCVCVILLRAFLGNHNELSNESCNATTAQHSTTAKLARFLP